MKVLDVKNVSLSYKTLGKNSIKEVFKFKRAKTFKALDNVSFSINKGEIIGLLGQNGSGKSTLLKLIANVFSPDEGTIDSFNNKVGLLALGVGFDLNLSGYENIYLSGMLMGYDKKYISSRIEDIINFSELEDFIHSPVSTYSSGMYSKLAFSIAVFLEVDILLIDEVLSVGDMHFNEKSYNMMLDIINNQDKTIIIVLHSLATIKELCNKVIWLNNGKMVKFGKTKEILREYEEFMKNLKK